MTSTPPPVLVVDDDEDLRSLVALMVDTAGLPVEEAANGVEALEAVRRRRPAVILLDMRMPVMDGWAFCAALRALDGAPPPIVVLTAAPDPALRAAEVHADAWLAKPFAYDDLVRILRRFTDGAAAAPQGVGAPGATGRRR